MGCNARQRIHSVVAILSLPSGDPLYLRRPPSHLNVNLVANLAIIIDRYHSHNHLSSTGLSYPIFVRTMLLKVVPLPVSTSKVMLVVETHIEYLKLASNPNIEANV